jgi:hypothetical protein
MMNPNNIQNHTISGAKISGRIILAVLLYLVTVTTGPLHAQTIREQASRDLEVMQQAFAEADSWILQSEIRMYDAPAGGNLLETAASTIMQKEGLRFEKHDGLEYLLSEKYHVIVDHESKTLSVGMREDNPKKKSTGFVSAESMLSACSKVEQISAHAGQTAYRFHYPEGDYETIEVWLDTGSKKCKKFIYHYRSPLAVEDGGSGQKPRMEIIYPQINYKPSFPTRQFSIERYCSIKGNTILPAAAYSDYQIIN